MKLLIDMNLSEVGACTEGSGLGGCSNVTPEHLGTLVVSALHQFEKHLEDGAIVTIDQKKLRARILPLQA